MITGQIINEISGEMNIENEIEVRDLGRITRLVDQSTMYHP